jgi:hypothetical protein
MPSVNLYIDSSNKRNGTNSNFSITLSSGLIKCNEDQGLEINLMNLVVRLIYGIVKLLTNIDIQL